MLATSSGTEVTEWARLDTVRVSSVKLCIHNHATLIFFLMLAIDYGSQCYSSRLTVFYILCIISMGISSLL